MQDSRRQTAEPVMKRIGYDRKFKRSFPVIIGEPWGHSLHRLVIVMTFGRS